MCLATTRLAAAFATTAAARGFLAFAVILITPLPGSTLALTSTLRNAGGSREYSCSRNPRDFTCSGIAGRRNWMSVTDDALKLLALAG
jgi:hypothetical protein